MSTDKNGPPRSAIRFLYGVYGAAAVGIVLGIWRDWFTQNAPVTPQVLPAVILGLVFVTVPVRGPGCFMAPPRPLRRFGMDFLKAVACWLATLAWVVVATRRVPDTRVGVAILVGPLFVGLAAGGYYLWRAMWGLTGGILRSVVTARTVPAAPVTDEAATVSGPLAGDLPDQVDYPFAYGAMLLRLCDTVALMAVAWWWLAKDDRLISVIAVGGVAYGAFVNLRMVIGRGPGLVLDSSGISMRAGLAMVSEVRWSQVTTVSLKSTGLYSVLAIGVRDPERLIEGQGAYRR
jgi:hypothetical protein